MFTPALSVTSPSGSQLHAQPRKEALDAFSATPSLKTPCYERHYLPAFLPACMSLRSPFVASGRGQTLFFSLAVTLRKLSSLLPFIPPRSLFVKFVGVEMKGEFPPSGDARPRSLTLQLRRPFCPAEARRWLQVLQSGSSIDPY